MSARFQVLFHSPPGVLFTIPSRYSSAIGHREVFRRPSGLGRFTQDSTGPVLLGAAPAQPAGFRLRGCHPLRPPVPGGSATRPVQCTAPRRGGDGKNAPRQHRARNPRRVIARARFNHHPLPLATTHGISTPAGTEMFHFPASPPAPYDIQTRVTPHNGRRVPPFGNPRITARKPAPRGISQATASFIGPRCQGIHRTLIKTNNTQNNTTHGAQRARPPRDHDAPTAPGHDDHRATAAHQRRAPQPARAARRTKQKNKQTGDQQHNSRYRGRPQMLASTMQFTTNPPTTPDPPEQGRARGPGHQGAPPQNPTACHAPHTPTPARRRPPTGPARGGNTREDEGGGPGPPPHGGEPAPPVPAAINEPLRKEVIQPHLPVRLPCYDFVPITGPAFDRSPWGHGLRASPTFMT